MITLHSVSKSVGRGRSRRLVLNNINWSVQPRQLYVILGQQGVGKSTLLNIMSGTNLPTSGWVERKGTISPGRTITRLGNAATTTPREIAKQLARLYHVPYKELIGFVPRFARSEIALDAPIKSLPRATQRRLTYAFIYGIPFDIYLFDGDVGPRNDAFGDTCRKAFEQRCRDGASAVVTTSNLNIARKFEGIGGVLFEGKIHLFENVEEAISIFNQLPRRKGGPQAVESEDDDDDEDEWL